MGVPELLFVFLVRSLAWLFTRGWPFGAGVLAACLIVNVPGAPVSAAWGTAAVVAAVCLLLRFFLRHPVQKERFRTLFKRRSG